MKFIVSLLLCTLCAGVFAAEADVVVAGSFPGKALLIINGGAPRAVAIGRSTPEGVKVLSIDGDAVTFSVGNGPRQTLRPGERVARVAASRGGGELILPADRGGHFRTAGSINGTRVNFLVDTGATLVSMGRSDARRAGIDYTAGNRSMAQTANGITAIWLVRINTLKIGDIVLHNVEAAVHDHDLPVTLLGMSALGRMELRNDGRRLIMRRRY